MHIIIAVALILLGLAWVAFALFVQGPFFGIGKFMAFASPGLIAVVVGVCLAIWW